MSVDLATTTDEDILRERLERLIPATLDRSSAIISLQRKRSDYSSSYHSEMITVQLDTGEKLQLFLKNFGSTRFLKDEAKQRRDRERSVYQYLLAGTDLGVAKYYGSVWDEGLSMASKSAFVNSNTGLRRLAGSDDRKVILRNIPTD
jgi:hypothetical protein